MDRRKIKVLVSCGVICALTFFMVLRKGQNSSSEGEKASKVAETHGVSDAEPQPEIPGKTVELTPVTAGVPDERATQSLLQEEKIDQILSPFVRQIETLEEKSSSIIEDKVANGVQKVIIRFTGVDEAWFAGASSEILDATSSLPASEKESVIAECLRRLRARAEPEYPQKSIFINNPQSGEGKFETTLIQNREAEPVIDFNGEFRPALSNGKMLYLSEKTVSSVYAHLFRIQE